MRLVRGETRTTETGRRCCAIVAAPIQNARANAQSKFESILSAEPIRFIPKGTAERIQFGLQKKSVAFKNEISTIAAQAA